MKHDEAMMKQRCRFDWKSHWSGQAVLYTAVDGVEEGESMLSTCVQCLSMHDCLIHEGWILNGEQEDLELNYNTYNRSKNKTVICQQRIFFAP